MVFQSTIPTVVGLTLAADTWVVQEGSYTAFASAAIALIATAVIFIPARRRGGLEARHLLVGGLFYMGYLIFVIGLIAGVF
jgi:amino acid permease